MTSTQQPQTESPANDALRTILHKHLLSLNYHAFTWVMIHLLERLGYAHIQPVGRTSFFGHNNHGGYDLEAKLPFALGERRVLVQVKQYDNQMVFRRAVDELRGACVRIGASEGVILSTGPVAPSLKKAGDKNPLLSSSPGIAPIQIVDRKELLDLLLLHSIGINPDSHIDEAYFAAMERFHTGPQRMDNHPDSPKFLLTVGVKKLGRQSNISQGSQENSDQVTRIVV